MLETLFTLFLALISFAPSQPAAPTGSAGLVEDSGTSTLSVAQEDRRGAFDPDGLTVTTTGGHGKTPKG